MQTKISTALLVFFFSSCIIHRCESSNPDNPTKQLYDDIQTRPLLIYECYESGVSINSAGSVNFTLLLDGTDPTKLDSIGTSWSAKKNTPNSYTRGDLTLSYDEASGVVKLVTSTVQEDFTVLKSVDGNVFYLKIVLTSKGNTEIYKIYDTDFKCKNAKKLLEEVCPDPCNLYLTRELLDE